MSESQMRTHAEPEGDIVMPFYIICDVSVSMVDDISDLNDDLRKLQQRVNDEPTIADVVQVGLITFSSAARVAVPLGNLEDATIPTLRVEGGTNYSAAFHVLRDAIDSDRQRLKSQGKRIYRPCAFFLTDGEPQDDNWARTFVDLFHYDPETKQGNRAYPRFIPFGFRDANLDVLSKIAYPKKDGKAFLRRAGSIQGTFDAIADFIARTIISTGMTPGSPAGIASQHQTPDEAEGMESRDSDYENDIWI